MSQRRVGPASAHAGLVCAAHRDGSNEENRSEGSPSAQDQRSGATSQSKENEKTTKEIEELKKQSTEKPPAPPPSKPKGE